MPTFTLGAPTALNPSTPVSAIHVDDARLDLDAGAVTLIIRDPSQPVAVPGTTKVVPVVLSPATVTALNADIKAALASKLGTSVT